MKRVDWGKTAHMLKFLRERNEKLRKNVCKILNSKSCANGGVCENCEYDMDLNISQKELATVLGYSTNSIINFENGRSRPDVDALLAYSELCELNIMDVIVLE